MIFVYYLAIGLFASLFAILFSSRVSSKEIIGIIFLWPVFLFFLFEQIK